MSECIFCRIAAGRAAARIVLEDEAAVVFHDLHPQAPVHLLVIPRRHVVSVAEGTADDRELFGHLLLLAARAARLAGVADSGYRIVTNCGADAGQSVFHLHLHVLGGRAMRWPPG